MGRTCNMHGRHACSILGEMPGGKKAQAQDRVRYEAVLNMVTHFHVS